jgi:hypothetical protein
VFCHREEKVEHVFLFCQLAVEVWRELKKTYPIQLQRGKFVNARDWIFHYLDRSSGIGCTVLAVTMWHLWDARNGVRNGDMLMNPNSLADKIKAYVGMIEQHLLKPATNHRCVSSKSVPHWFLRRRRKVQCLSV